MAAAERYNAEHLLRKPSGDRRPARHRHRVGGNRSPSGPNHVFQSRPTGGRRSGGWNGFETSFGWRSTTLPIKWSAMAFQRKTFAFETEPRCRYSEDQRRSRRGVGQLLSRESTGNGWAKRRSTMASRRGSPERSGWSWSKINVMYPKRIDHHPFRRRGESCLGQRSGLGRESAPRHLAILDLINLYNTRDYDGSRDPPIWVRTKPCKGLLIPNQAVPRSVPWPPKHSESSCTI